MPELIRIRHGIGGFFIAFGVAHTLAAVFGLGGRVYFTEYLLFVLGGIGYLFYNFRSTKVFYYEALADYLIGLALFVILLSPYAGLLLIAYGLFLVNRS